MKIGVFRIHTGYSIDPAVFAKRAEELGFHSFWAAEHPILPVDVKTGFLGQPGEPIPPIYGEIADPFIALARASAVTTRIKLGTGICLVPERNPLLLAKEIATLDHYSGGRFVFGVGAGWLKEEIQIMGGDSAHPWTQTEEAVRVMKELWSKDEAEYHGRFYDFPLVKSLPKPVQKPHPPVFLGGWTENVLKRTAEWGDGWMPSHFNPERVHQGRETLDRFAIEAGRDPKSIQVIPYGVPPKKSLLDGYEAIGIAEVAIRVKGIEEKEVLSELEQMAKEVFK